jgi:hypothetical protein
MHKKSVHINERANRDNYDSRGYEYLLFSSFLFRLLRPSQDNKCAKWVLVPFASVRRGNRANGEANVAPTGLRRIEGMGFL